MSRFKREAKGRKGLPAFGLIVLVQAENVGPSMTTTSG